MRSWFKIIVVVAAVSVFASDLFAQSGSRGGGGSSAPRARASSGGGGGVSRRSGGGVSRGVSRNRLSDAERAAIALKQYKQQAELAAQLQELQAETQRQNFQNTVIVVDQKENVAENKRQNRTAFDEAKKDYQALRSGAISPEELRELKSPFRLGKSDFSRDEQQAIWPESLESDTFGELTNNLKVSLANGGITDAESAESFINDLGVLNRELNSVAARGEIPIKEYAKARRFVTGLANEIIASDLLPM